MAVSRCGIAGGCGPQSDGKFLIGVGGFRVRLLGDPFDRRREAEPEPRHRTKSHLNRRRRYHDGDASSQAIRHSRRRTLHVGVRLQQPAVVYLGRENEQWQVSRCVPQNLERSRRRRTSLTDQENPEAIRDAGVIEAPGLAEGLVKGDSEGFLDVPLERCCGKPARRQGWMGFTVEPPPPPDRGPEGQKRQNQDALRESTTQPRGYRRLSHGLPPLLPDPVRGIRG
jgi:hypothetical protein